MMRIKVSFSLRMVGFLAVFATHLCFGADPKILRVKLSEVDISHQIDGEPQGGGTLKPLRKLNYESLKSMLWKGSGATLLADGADPNATSSEGEPILFDVLQYGKNGEIKDLEYFLKAGADPNRKNRNGNTPLHFAIWHNAAEFVKLLLQYGADPNVESSGETAIEFARRHRKEFVEILEANNLPQLSPKRIHPPEFLRHPDVVFGSELFRPAIGGEAIIYSDDSRQVISGGDDGAIRFFDANSGEVQNVIAAHDGAIDELARIPGTEILVSSDGFETKFWDMEASRELMRVKCGGRGLSVSPNGRWIFNGYHLWEIESTNPLRLAAEGRGYPQAGSKVIISWTFFTPDNRYLIFGVQDGYVYVWNLNNDYVRRIGNLKTTEMQSLKWSDLNGIVDIGTASPDDLLALATSQYTILTGPANVLQSFKSVLNGAVREVRSLACSPNGRYLAAIGYASHIEIFDQNRGGQKLPLKGHTSGLQAVAVSPDGKLIASGGDDKTVRLWDRVSGEQVRLIETASFVYSLCFSPLGGQLAIGDNDGIVYVHDLETSELKKWRGRGRMTRLQFDAKGEVLIALGFDLTAFDARTGESLDSVPSVRSAQGSFTMTPDNLIIGTSNGIAANETFSVPCAWSVNENRFAVRPNLFSERMGHRSFILSVATSPDGTLLAAESSFAIRLWDLKMQAAVGDPLVGHTYYVQDMRFSPDGKLLASGGGNRDGTIRVWEVPSGRLLLVLDADVNRVSSVDFLPDGSLVSANGNGTVHLWNLPKYLSENEPQ